METKKPKKETKMSQDEMIDLVEKMKKAGVHAFTVDGLSVNLLPEVVAEAWRASQPVKNEEPETEEQKQKRIQKEEDDDLYHSC